MKEKYLTIMTSFGRVPYNVVKDYLPKEAVEFIEENKKELMNEIEYILRDIFIGEDYYIHTLAEKLGWEKFKMSKYLEHLSKISPAAATSILLKEIAIDFDNEHEGHIEDSKEIWTISMLNGKVEQVDKSKVKNYRNFPAFRSEKEAKEAHAILSKRLRSMFRGCGE